MPRIVLLPCVLLLLGGTARAEEDRRDALTRTLQAHVDRAIREAGPSVACIYVSRSDAYYKAPYWGVGERPDYSGQLGAFDAVAARKRVPIEARHRARVLRSIRDHDLSDPAVVPESYGSGIVVDRTGLILTNAHVVRNATKIFVRLSGQRSSWADIHACDPRSDLAVVKLLDPPAGLKALPLGDGGSVRAGKFVISLVYPFVPRAREENEPRVSCGAITNLRNKAPGNVDEMKRSEVTLHHYGTLIRTDAKTTPGCSGGALLDLDGKVIALTTALAGVSGAKPGRGVKPGVVEKPGDDDKPGGVAIPFDANTRRIIDVLKRGEEVEYGFLGVVVHKEMGQRPNGVRLGQISPGSPAALAGLLANDRILSINGNAVRDNDDLFLYIGMALAGSTARVEVGRGLRSTTYSIKLAKFYVPGPVIAAKRPPAKFGLRVDYNSIICQRNPFFPRWGRATADGVVIREVTPAGPADKASLQPDKIITEVNGKAVTTPAEYYREIARTGNKVELTFLDSEGRSQRLTLQDK